MSFEIVLIIAFSNFYENPHYCNYVIVSGILNVFKKEIIISNKLY